MIDPCGPMTEVDIKNAIKAIEVHHEHGWWIAEMPDIGVATQATTLPALGVEIERIIVAHFEVSTEHGIDPFGHKRLSSIDEVTKTLNVVLETRTATYAAMASALREIERRLVTAESAHDLRRIRAEVSAAASAVAAVASLVETPLTTRVGGN